MYTPVLIGLALSAAVAAYASLTKLDRSPAFYTTVLIVVASYYVLFAIMGGSRHALIADIVVMGAFAVLATLGHARNMWLVVVGLAAHGVMDAFHGRIIDNPGVPAWWPAWCLSYDVGASILLALILVRRRAEVV
jgi:hypothetical protein